MKMHNLLVLTRTLSIEKLINQKVLSESFKQFELLHYVKCASKCFPLSHLFSSKGNYHVACNLSLSPFRTLLRALEIAISTYVCVTKSYLVEESVHVDHRPHFSHYWRGTGAQKMKKKSSASPLFTFAISSRS